MGLTNATTWAAEAANTTPGEPPLPPDMGHQPVDSCPGEETSYTLANVRSGHNHNLRRER